MKYFPVVLFALSTILTMIKSCPAYADPSAGAGEAAHTGWSFSLDEDLLLPHYQYRDRDYSGGLSLSWGGAEVAKGLSLEPVREFGDHLFGVASAFSDNALQRHQMELGLQVFTPQYAHNPKLQAGDRPFATLMYWGNSAVSVNTNANSALYSRVELGVLGAHAVNNLQAQLHKLTRSNEPVGEEHQISDGGELTFRYALAKSHLLTQTQFMGSAYELSTSAGLSAGYLSQLNAGAVMRWGSWYSPWWNFQPQLSDYAEKAHAPAGSDNRDGHNSGEHYFWLASTINWRVYNALLQGQVRHSDTEFHYDELRRWVFETSTGYSLGFANGWLFSASLRWVSPEVKNGIANRHYAWGSLELAHGW